MSPILCRMRTNLHQGEHPLLTCRFKQVVAIEPNAKQLQHAVQADNVLYREGAAEASGMTDASVDLVASAQACHW